MKVTDISQRRRVPLCVASVSTSGMGGSGSGRTACSAGEGSHVRLSVRPSGQAFRGGLSGHSLGNTPTRGKHPV